MFFRGRFFMRTLLVLLLVGVFASVAGRWSYNAGWSDGYVTAQARAEGSDGEAAAAPPTSHTAPYRGWGFGPVGWFFGGLLKFWLFLLLIGLSLKLLGWRSWGWRHHRHHHPWRGYHEHGATHEKGPEDVEPDIRKA